MFGLAHYYESIGSPTVRYYKTNLNQILFFKEYLSHRENGPSIINFYPNGKLESLHYYINGNNHRWDGPANYYFYYNGEFKVSYYINGNRINAESQKEFEMYKQTLCLQ